MSEAQPPSPVLSKGWTTETYAAHNEAQWASLFQFLSERDRRYAEVDAEREKARLAMEEVRREALVIAREIQTYKDEKANELRSQIERERVGYAQKSDLVAAMEKMEAIVKPLNDYVTAQGGRDKGIGLSAGIVVTVATIALSAVGLGITIAVLA